MRDFKIGDRVMVVKSNGYIRNGDKHTIIDIKTLLDPEIISDKNDKYLVYLNNGEHGGYWQWRFKLLCNLPDNIRVL